MPKKFPAKVQAERYNPVLFFICFIAAIGIVALIAAFLTGGTFIEISNLKVIVSNSIYPSIIAWGFCFLFAAGYYDLSLGGIIVLASFSSCVFGNLFGYPGVILGGMVVGTLLVLLNSVIFVYTSVPTWIASISLTLIYEGFAVFLRMNEVTKPFVEVELRKDFRAIGNTPWNIFLLIAIFIIVYLVYNRTNIGLNIRALGGSREVSRALGVNTVKALIWTGLICGLLIGASSVVQQSYNGRTTPLTALTSLQLMFKPLAIALLAQILQKRMSIIVAVPFCSIIIFGVFNVMTFFHIPTSTLQEVFLCLFIIAFGLVGQRGVKEVVK